MEKYKILDYKINKSDREYHFVLRDMDEKKVITVSAMCKKLSKEIQNRYGQKYIKTVQIDSVCDKNKVYKELLKIEPGFLFYIPYEEQTEELKRIALTQDGNSLEFIFKDDITEELSNLAVSSNGLAIYYVPKKFQTMKLCRQAIATNPKAILKMKKSIATNLYEEITSNDFSFIGNFTHDEFMYMERNFRK